VSVTPAEILLVVCRVCGVLHKDMVSTSRHRQLVMARRVYVALCREMTEASYPEIASVLEKKSHSTAVLQMQAFERTLAENEHMQWMHDKCWLEVRRMQREKAEREQEAARC
jgi:chromosomal replication initiator protein